MRRSVLLFFLVFLSHTCYLQQYSFDSYSTNNGLSQSQVYDIEQDQNGFLWVATEGGLNKFDGNSFKIYTSEDGLIKDDIRSLFVLGNKLYAGSKGGICIFSEKKFSQVLFPEEFENRRVDCIQYFNDTVFVGTNGESVFYVDGKALVPYTKIDKGLKIRDLYATEEELLISTKRGLFVKHLNGKMKHLHPDVSFGRIKVENDKVYVGTYKPTNIYRYSKGKLKHLNYINSSETIRDFQPMGESICLITKSLLVCYNRISQQKEFEISVENGLPEGQLLRTFKDREGNLWIGTDGKGLTRFVGETFVSFSKKEGIGSNQIMYIHKKDSIFYLGSYNNGVTVWSRNGYSKIINAENGLPSNTVWTMHVKSPEEFMIGTQQGLSIYKNGKLKNYFKSDGLLSDKITTIAELSPNKYLIGGPEGVSVFDGERFDSTFYGVELRTWIRQIKIANSGEIWFATLSGVYVYSNGELKKLKNDYGFSEVNSLDLISEKKALIGSDKGVYLIENDRIFESGIQLSKTSKEVNMVKYFGSTVCFGTNSGIYIGKIDPDQMKIYDVKRFSAEDGLPGSEVNLNSVYVEDKAIWFGMEEALVKFRSDHISDLEDFIEPKLSITNLKIFLEEMDLSEFSEGNDENGLPINLKLPYRYNYVTIEFAGISFKNTKEVKYQYKLEGFGDEWTPLLKNDFATFTSMSPGVYTFKVRAINKSGLVSEVAEFTFEVLPPFWLTWWFITLSLVGIIGVVTFIINYRTKVIKQKKDNENLVYKSKLLQLEQQSLNASMNRHFIFNSLNSIQYFINISDKISANKYLTNFAKLIRKNLDSTTNENNMVILSDEISRLELYLSLESMRFSGKFEYRIEVDPSVDIEMLEVPSMMLQPFVENSIIHGILPKKEKGHIDIKIFIQDSFVVFEIKDDGIGIKESQKIKENYDSEHDSKGMEITANRVDILKRVLRKDLKIVGPRESYDQAGKVVGTIVEIFLKIE